MVLVPQTLLILYQYKNNFILKEHLKLSRFADILILYDYKLFHRGPYVLCDRLYRGRSEWITA